MAEINSTPDPLNGSEHIDLLTRRIIQARAVLNALLVAMDGDDGSVTDDVARNTVWAATELLEV